VGKVTDFDGVGAVIRYTEEREPSKWTTRGFGIWEWGKLRLGVEF